MRQQKRRQGRWCDRLSLGETGTKMLMIKRERQREMEMMQAGRILHNCLSDQERRREERREQKKE